MKQLNLFYEVPEYKFCTKCKINKPISNYSKQNAAKDGLQNKCKACVKVHNQANKDKIKERQKTYYQANKDIIKEQQKAYNQANKDKIKEQLRTYYKANRDRINERQKTYYKDNRDRKIEYIKQYNQANIDRIREYKKAYYQANIDRIKFNKEANKDKTKEYQKKYSKTRRHSSPLFKLSGNIRNLISKSLQNKGYKKNSKTCYYLGCDYYTLLNHLNNNKYDFVYGKEGYDIDHIIPLASAETEEDVIALNHYTNLQLLPSEFNRHIKRDRVMTLEEIDYELKLFQKKSTY